RAALEGARRAGAAVLPLLGVDLRPPGGPRLDRRREADAVVAPGLPEPAGRGAVADLRLGEIRVDEVEARAVLDAREQAQRAAVPHAIPAHVGHVQRRREAPDDPRDDVESPPLAELLAGREQ